MGNFRSPIHKARLVGADGSISALCYSPPRAIDLTTETFITSDFLNEEVTCPDCLEAMGVNLEPSLSTLLMDSIQICLDNYRFVVDFIELNKEREAVGSEILDGDHYAGAMRDFANFDSVHRQIMAKMRARMKPAENWGWPDQLDEKSGEKL